MWIFPVNIISTFYFLQKFVNIIDQKRNEVKKVYLRIVLCYSEQKIQKTYLITKNYFILFLVIFFKFI